ncbi:PREDICTED: ras-interacting protein RIP3-like, partial [Rhagoletis zephyria]|uniref:ras-interacting protein RIP3-like n=1 Tax=Rhagoletis zephyria TaxID=28612 RepID=UPI00081169BD
MPPTAATISANNNTKLCDNILSQQSPDLIQKQQRDSTAGDLQLETAATFQFTSPTATFKRKKQQQQQQLQHQQIEYQLRHNNNNCLSSQTVVATLIKNSLHTEQQQQQQKQRDSKSPSRNSIGGNNLQHAATVSTSILMNGGGPTTTTTITKETQKAKTTIADSILGLATGASSVGDAGAAVRHIESSTTTTRSPRNRTLPRVATTTTTPRAAYAADSVDLVGSHTSKASPVVVVANSQQNGHDKRQRATIKVKQAQRQYQQQQQEKTLQQQALPKRMPKGAAVTGSGSASASASGNSSNHSNNNNNNTLYKGNNDFMDSLGAHLELVGWRKKCLYGLLVLLMLLIITNLVLTLWILKVMEFTTDGMGHLKIVPGGIQLTGQALIMDMLRASTIRSRHGQPIAI